MMQPTAAINHRFQNISSLLDQSLSLYSTEEGMQISALMATRPISSTFLGMRVSFGTMAFFVQIGALPAIIAISSAATTRSSLV